MKEKAKVIEVSRGAGKPPSNKVVGEIEIEGRDDDALRAAIRDKLKARKVRSISRGPRGFVVYIEPRRRER